VHRVHRVLLRRTCQPHRPPGLLDRRVEDDAGGFHLHHLSVFSVLFFKESVTINPAIGYSPIALGAFFVFKAPL